MRIPAAFFHAAALRRRPSVGWRAACIAAAFVVSACGGGDPDAAEATPDDDVGVAKFAVQPAGLRLVAGKGQRLLAVQAPGAIAWSSSDPAVASVDADGAVTAVGAGTATVSASSGGAAVTATVKVYAPTAATSSTLIAAALAQNRIDASQALAYRVFAMFGDPRLPAEFEGAPDGAPDHMLLRQVAAALPTLPAATRDALLPFLLPPIYAESWFAQQPGLPGASGKRRGAAAPRLQASATTVNCDVAAHAAHWTSISSPPFRIHYRKLGSGADDYQQAGAEAIAAVIQDVWSAETGLLARGALDDAGEGCNGGDGAVDVYLSTLGSSATRGLTTAYPDRCNHVPSFVVVNAADAALLLNALRPAEGRRELKAILAHELAHVLQFAMDRGGALCEDYEWLDEATAEWAMDYVDETWNREDGADKVSSNHGRSGSFYAQYLYSDHMASIEKPGLTGDAKTNGYADYIFFQYLARKHGAQTIKRVFDATATLESVEAVEAALAPQGGMRTVWPDFAMTLWNDKIGQNLDDWNRWDAYDFGLALVFEQRGSVPPSARTKTIEVDQQGQPRQSFPMLKSALDGAGGTGLDFHEIQPRSIFYQHLKVTDPTISSLYFFNPIGAIVFGGGIAGNGPIKVQAKLKISGVWKPTEDWTAEPYKQFCLDRRDERIEELLVVVSNSEVNRGAETPFRFPKDVPMLTSTSNVGCYRWLATASKAISGGTPVVDSLASGASMLWIVTETLPGRMKFGPSAGDIAGRTTISDVCTTTMVGERRSLYRGLGDDNIAKPDGMLDFNLDLDLGFNQIGGMSPDRKLISLSGTTELSTTTTAVCGPVTTTAVGPHPWDWLSVDDPTQYTVSADGKTIEGRFTGAAPTGSMINTLWKFTAVRE